MSRSAISTSSKVKVLPERVTGSLYHFKNTFNWLKLPKPNVISWVLLYSVCRIKFSFRSQVMCKYNTDTKQNSDLFVFTTVSIDDMLRWVHFCWVKNPDSLRIVSVNTYSWCCNVLVQPNGAVVAQKANTSVSVLYFMHKAKLRGWEFKSLLHSWGWKTSRPRTTHLNILSSILNCRKQRQLCR